MSRIRVAPKSAGYVLKISIEAYLNTIYLVQNFHPLEEIAIKTSVVKILSSLPADLGLYVPIDSDSMNRRIVWIKRSV